MGESIHYSGVDLYVAEGDEIEDYDVRLIFDVGAKELRITEEDDPQGVTYAKIPYDAVTSVIYSQARPGTPSWEDVAKEIAIAQGVDAAVERIPEEWFFENPWHNWFAFGAGVVVVGVVTRGGAGAAGIMDRWFVLTFEDVPAHPEGLLILRLGDRHYPLIWATTETQLGINIKRVETGPRPEPMPIVTPTQKGSGDVTRVWKACRGFIEEKFAAKRIRWDTGGETRIVRQGEDRWSVTLDFFAEDPSGTSTEHASLCEVRKGNAGEWALTKLQIRPRSD